MKIKALGTKSEGSHEIAAASIRGRVVVPECRRFRAAWIFPAPRVTVRAIRSLSNPIAIGYSAFSSRRCRTGGREIRPEHQRDDMYRNLLTIGAALVLLAGCASSMTSDIVVETERNPKVSFAGYQSYSWLGSAAILRDHPPPARSPHPCARP